MPVSLTTISTCELTRSSRTCTRPPFGVNFTAFDSRFHTTCCRRSGSPETGPTRGSMTALDAHALGVGRRLHGGDGVVDDAGSSTGCTSSRILPETMRDTSSTSSTICVSQRALRSSVSRPRADLVRRQHVAAQQARVAEDRVERRAQLVRQHREEFVLQAVGVLRLGVQPRVLERDRGPRRDADRQPLVLLGEHARLRVAEEQSAEHSPACP